MMNFGSRVIMVAPILAALALLLVPPPSASADTSAPQITALPDAVRVEWSGAPAAMRGLQSRRDAPQLVAIGGVQLPAKLVALRMAGPAPAVPQIERLTSAGWDGALPAAQQLTPRLADGAARPDLAPARSSALPTAPVLVLRESRMRGAHIIVLALSPVFAEDGAARLVTSLAVTIPGATPLAEDAATLLDSSVPFLAAAPAPRNPLAGQGWRVRVAQAGIQSLPAAALASVGVPASSPALLHLYHNGSEVALEQRGAGANLELRFYAAEPGDRWNATDTFWLALETRPGRRMASRSALPGVANISSTARARGIWRHNKLYDSLLPGADGDHWYAADLRVAPAPPGQPQPAPVTMTAIVTPSLPIVPGGAATLTVAGSSYLNAAHTLNVTVGGTARTATWSGVGDWSHTLAFPAAATSIYLTLPPASNPDGYEVDNVAWDLPVALDAGGHGAAFAGLDGTWRYQLANVASTSALYDVSDPAAPSVLVVPSGASPLFEDGPAARQYLLAGSGTLFAPAISRSQPFDLATPANLLYIAPAALQSALGPLLARRQAQGYQVRLIDVQALYDAWSFGQINPAAIRDFLRYAAASWSTPPKAVVLVGDGTSDPLNYSGRNSTTFIPPYLAMVDPWLGETACEACYARLDGDDPTLDALPDLMLGRLPVKSAAELSALAAKLVAYETSPLDLSWRSRSLYVADNFLNAQNVPDEAGDFAAFADASIAQQPANLHIRRMYYDPSPAAIGVPWRERDPVRAYQRTAAAMSEGAGLVNYIGHGSAYQWATTELDRSPPYLFGQYDPDDLTNGARQPIVLEMTCLTSAFQTPAYSGTTIDERLLLNPNGGAIAVWGPAGLGVAHGHDALQRGFYNALWSAPPLKSLLGQLTTAGSLELFTHGTCCQDTLATYLLLGDPTTPARVMPAQQLYLPISRH